MSLPENAIRCASFRLGCCGYPGCPRRYGGSMTDKEPSSGRTWRYRFSLTDGEEIEIREFSRNEAAEDPAGAVKGTTDSHHNPISRPR